MPPGSLQPRAAGLVTRYLRQLHDGDTDAMARLTEAVYQELRRLAAATINRQIRPQTIQPTELLHEFYLEMQGAEIGAESRAQFFALAAKTMRNILVDHARKRHASKRGGVKVTLHDVPAPGDTLATKALDVLDVHEALERFGQSYPRHAELVELRFFGGLSAEEAVPALHAAGYDCSLRTVERDWRFARAWLHKAIEGRPKSTPGV